MTSFNDEQIPKFRYSEDKQISLFREWCRENLLLMWTSDDVWVYFRQKYPRFHKWLTQPNHWNYIGSFCSEVKKQGLVDEVGRRPSSRESAKTRKISVYRWREG